MAPTPASARALTPSTFCWMGPAEATSGDLRVSPMYLV